MLNKWFSMDWYCAMLKLNVFVQPLTFSLRFRLLCSSVCDWKVYLAGLWALRCLFFLLNGPGALISWPVMIFLLSSSLFSTNKHWDNALPWHIMFIARFFLRYCLVSTGFAEKITFAWLVFDFTTSRCLQWGRLFRWWREWVNVSLKNCSEMVVNLKVSWILNSTDLVMVQFI